MKIEELIPIVYQGQRVLTGKQIAELYNVSDKTIKENFRNAKRYFVEGEHFFKVEGEDLYELKEQVNEEIAKRFMRGEQAKNFCSTNATKSPLTTYTRSAILYTAKGCVRHCKSLQSPKAWEVFGELETAYFGQEIASPVQQTLPAEQSLFPEIAPKMEVKKKRPLPEFAVVYALLMSNNVVKIGYTSEFNRRIREVRKGTKLEIIGWHTTAFMPIEEAMRLEASLKARFTEYALANEFFNAPFNLVCAAFDNPAQKLIALAEKISETTTRDKILTHAANLLVGHQLF